MRIFRPRRTSDNGSCRNLKLLRPEPKDPGSIDDVNHFLIAGVGMVRESRLARRYIEKAVAEFLRAYVRAHALPETSKGRSLRRANFIDCYFREIDHMLVFHHKAPLIAFASHTTIRRRLCAIRIIYAGLI